MATAGDRLVDDLVQHRWVYVALAAAAAIWCWVDVAPRGGINPARIFEHRTDFTVYTEAGAAFFDGRDPYEVSNPRGWHYLYPPLFALFVAPLHAVSSTTQVTIWFALNVVLLFGCYREARKLTSIFVPVEAAGELETSRFLRWVALAAVLAALLPVLNCLQRGQVEILKLYLLLLGFRLASSGRTARIWVVAGVVLAAAIVVKVTPLLPVGCLVAYEGLLIRSAADRRAACLRAAALGGGVAGGIALLIFIVPALATGWSENLRNLDRWSAHVVTKAIDVRTSDFGEDVRSVRNQSLDNSAYRFGNWLLARTGLGADDSIVDHPHPEGIHLPMDNIVTSDLIVSSRFAALAILFAFLIRATGCSDPIGRAGMFGLGCAATLVVCPVARGCYFLLLFPAIAATSTWFLHLGRPRLALGSAFFLAALVWLHYVLLPFAGRIGLLGLGTAGWFGVISVLLERFLRQRAAFERAAHNNRSLSADSPSCSDGAVLC